MMDMPCQNVATKIEFSDFYLYTRVFFYFENQTRDLFINANYNAIMSVFLLFHIRLEYMAEYTRCHYFWFSNQLKTKPLYIGNHNNICAVGRQTVAHIIPQKLLARQQICIEENYDCIDCFFLLRNHISIVGPKRSNYLQFPKHHSYCVQIRKLCSECNHIKR